MISKRLEIIASMVPKEKVVFDVGSDHALLPCYLVDKGISQKVYAGDNKKGPLDSAIKNINNYGFKDKIIPVLSNGLENASDDVEVVIIAGMGYHTAVKIIEEANIGKYELFIVQINKNADALRRYISLHQYTIIDEEIVYDNFYYEIIAFSSQYHESYDEEEITFGPILLEKKSDIFKNYLRFKIKTLKNIINNKGSDETISEKIASCQNILKSK